MTAELSAQERATADRIEQAPDALGLREEVAEVLAAHEYDAVLHKGSYVPGCKCGWVADDEWADVSVYDAHVADALLPLIERREAEAWDKGWDAAIDAAERCDVAGPDMTCGECAVCCPPNPYRADQIGGTR